MSLVCTCFLKIWVYNSLLFSRYKPVNITVHKTGEKCDITDVYGYGYGASAADCCNFV